MKDVLWYVVVEDECVTKKHRKKQHKKIKKKYYELNCVAFCFFLFVHLFTQLFLISFKFFALIVLFFFDLVF